MIRVATRTFAKSIAARNNASTVPYLNIKLPDISAPPPEPLVHIPFTPDFWESSRAKAAANPAPPEEPHVPKVIVVAGDSSRADSSIILEPVRDHVDLDHHSSNPKVSNLRSIFLDIADDAVLPKDLNVLKVTKNRQGLLDDLIEETTTSVGESKFHTRTLDRDEVRGVWIILGLFAGSWLAGGLLKKETKQLRDLPEANMLILRPRPPPLTLRSLRLLHSSARICDHVAPPDPISNIRPILYDDPAPVTSESLRHPYSLDEFRDDSDTLEYQWKLQRQQLDAFNDNFWRDSNTRFEVAKAAAMSGFPPHATAQQREERLGKFYRNWVLQEAPRQVEYNAEWRRRSVEEITLSLRVSYHRLKARFTS